MKHKFPKDFLWGVAYSSHQVEGNNKNNDWWQWEEKGKTKDKSLWACDTWNRYLVDHKLAGELGCNAFRLSLEWSRIQPQEGEFSDETLNHYKKVLQDLKNRGMKRVVTLWHWTSPIWFVKKYGWHKKESVELFEKYCEKVLEFLGEEIDILISINEPRLPLNQGYLLGKHPPGKRFSSNFFKARINMVEAQRKCYELCKKNNILSGITQFCNDFDFIGGIKKINYLVERIENFYNWWFFDQIGETQDFIGINYYTCYSVELLPPFIKRRGSEKKVTDMNWKIWPEGLYEIVKDAWQHYGKPIYIFENGLADAEDRYRTDFIKDHLKWLHKAIKEGVDVRGYFHWSLIDNFEWTHGFEPHFGLCEMNYKTMERKPRKSYYEYQKIIKNNGL